MGPPSVPSEQCQCFEFCAIFLSDRSKLRHEITIPPFKGAFVSTVQSVLQIILFVKEDCCVANQLKTFLEIVNIVAMQYRRKGQEVFSLALFTALTMQNNVTNALFWGCPNEAL